MAPWHPTTSGNDPMQPSDPPYKVLFRDPGLFEETVRLVAPELADALDFDTATSLDKEHLTELARTRLQDKLHRVEFKEGELKNGRRPHVLVLLEFQSRHDPEMAWRMRDYTRGAPRPLILLAFHNRRIRVS